MHGTFFLSEAIEIYNCTWILGLQMVSSFPKMSVMIVWYSLMGNLFLDLYSSLLAPYLLMIKSKMLSTAVKDLLNLIIIYLSSFNFYVLTHIRYTLAKSNLFQLLLCFLIPLCLYGFCSAWNTHSSIYLLASQIIH